MEWLGDLLGTGASIAGGSIVGVLGSITGVVAKHYQEKARRAHQKDEWVHEETMHKLQMEAQAAETEQEIALASTEGAWIGLTSSINADMFTNKDASQWVIDIKSLFRPLLTLILWIAAIWVFNEMISILKGQEDSIISQVYTFEEVKDLIKYMIYTIFFSASTATVWWYGDRALTPPHLKHR